MSFGQKLQQARKRKKLTQLEVASKLGIDDTTISKYEKDRSEPDNVTLRRLAELYEVSIDSLMDHKHSPDDYTKGSVIEEFNRLPKEKQKLVTDMISALLDERK